MVASLYCSFALEIGMATGDSPSCGLINDGDGHVACMPPLAVIGVATRNNICKATIIIANAGMYSTWPSPSLIKLHDGESPVAIPISNAEESWIVSSYFLGLAIGGLISGLVMDKFGRKSALLAAALPMFVPWIVIIFAKDVLVLIIARTVAGMGCSIGFATSAVYIGEVADKDIRGKLGTTVNVMKLFGGLFVLSIGSYTSYTVLAASCSVFPVIFMVLFYFMPESPYYLIKVGKKDAATENLIRLARTNIEKPEVDDRINEIQETIDYDIRNKSSMWEFVSSQEYRRAFLVMLGVKTLQQFSGFNAINPYLQTIIETSNSSISTELSGIICGFVQIPAVLVAMVLVDKTGRKPLLIISALGCAIALLAEGTFFYLQDVAKANVDSILWLPTTALILYLIMNPLGVFTLPYVLMGEMFATNIKGSASTFMTVYGASLGFLVAKFFRPISEAWGMYTMFWIFAGCCILGAMFVFLFLPETKGKSFMEIQKKLNKK